MHNYTPCLKAHNIIYCITEQLSWTLNTLSIFCNGRLYIIFTFRLLLTNSWYFLGIAFCLFVFSTTDIYLFYPFTTAEMTFSGRFFLGMVAIKTIVYPFRQYGKHILIANNNIIVFLVLDLIAKFQRQSHSYPYHLSLCLFCLKHNCCMRFTYLFVFELKLFIVLSPIYVSLSSPDVRSRSTLYLFTKQCRSTAYANRANGCTLRCAGKLYRCLFFKSLFINTYWE